MERNDHHAFWNRCEYRSKPYGYLRKLTVVKNVLIDRHNELHAEMPPPPMPSRPLAFNLVGYLMEHEAPEPLDGLFNAVDYLRQVCNEESLVLSEHLLDQARILGE